MIISPLCWQHCTGYLSPSELNIRLTFKALNGLAPPYISELLEPHVPGRCLRSSSSALLVVPRTNLVTKGDRAFAARAPRLWNKLPHDVRVAGSLTIFKTKLKTLFYREAFLTTWSWHFYCFIYRNVFVKCCVSWLIVLFYFIVVKHFGTLFKKVLYK